MKILAFLGMVLLSTNLFAYDVTKVTEADVQCLAQNIYFEARDQELVGQVAVAFVTLNRVNSWRYRDTICGVVRDGYSPSRRDCHFSWYCDGKSDIPTEARAWETALIIAKTVIQDYAYITDPTDGATHYHTHEVNPWWAPKLAYIGTIGDHIFYDRR